ncbi:MAG TPA: SpoIIE family protein phosphatase [Oligoflexus sp.]|uniref:SpoIIE family protein phosphatase n=1 Tax=Oligoflexus sp. TaxID=1971216 RepID=UPI002D7F459A|nr:SpoIIE family protein phosphatase [Oligoflexus sp.]HET9238482.1 SpoIIE family protein phosphatase [Oligoflexus sp.]
MRKFFRCCLIVLCLQSMVLNEAQAARDAAPVEAGRLRPGAWDPSAAKALQLRGSWNFYPGVFLGTERTAKDQWPTAMPLNLPGSWANTTLGKTGFGTYIVELPSLPGEPGLYLGGFPQNYRLLAGTLDLNRITPLFSGGLTGKTADSTRNQLKRGLAPLPDFCREGCYLFLEVSDFVLANGASIGEAPLLDHYPRLLIQVRSDVYIEYLTLGMLGFALFFNLGLYLRHREDTGSLILVGFVLLNIIRYMYTYAVPGQFTQEPLQTLDTLIRKAGYASAPLINICFVAFFQVNFPDFFGKRFLRLQMIVSIPLALIIIAGSSRVMEQAIYIAVAVSLISFLYCIVRMIQAMLARTEMAFVSFIGLCAYAIALFNSFFIAINLYDGPSFVNYGLLIFIFVQSQIVGMRFARTFRLIKELNNKLVDQEKTRTAFFHNTSHELRTPLNGIIGHIDLLQRQEAEQLSSKAQETLRKCLRLAEALKNQVNTILDLARSKRGELELQVSRIDVNGLKQEADSLAEGLNFKSQRSHYQSQIIMNDDQTHAINDQEKILTILRNLIGNAFKFGAMHRDNDVALRLILNRETLIIEVADTGIGIPITERQRIFEAFTQVTSDARRRYEGTGLGLAMVHDLVRFLGGTIELESTVDQGSLFRVILPHQAAALLENRVARHPAVSKPAPIALPDGTDPGPMETASWDHLKARQAARILVVDDNATNREVMFEILKSANYEVILAEGGQEALEKMRQEEFQLVLLDLMMPEVSGEDVMNTMKKEGLLVTVPVILITARASDEDRILGLTLGADDYLAKPILSQELLLRVRNLLERNQYVRTQKEHDVVEKMLFAAQNTERDASHHALPPHLKLADLYTPAENTGGDWFGYDYHEASKRLYIGLGDVTGHGVHSALVTLAVAGAIRGTWRLLEGRGSLFSIDEALYLMHQSAQEAVRFSGKHAEKMMTMVFLVIDLERRELHYLNAGHLPIYIRQGTQLTTMLQASSPLGIHDSDDFQRRTLSLEADAMVFVFSDGLTENHGPAGEHLKSRELQKILVNAKDPNQLKAALVEKTQALWGQTPLEDDVSFVCLQVS